MGLYMTEKVEEKIKEKVKREFPHMCVNVNNIRSYTEPYPFMHSDRVEVDVDFTGSIGGFMEDLESKHISQAIRSSREYRSADVIKNVVFHDPATIVYWFDGTKTVVKCSEDEPFDPEKGLAMAISKKFFGNQGNYYNKFKKWLPEPDPEYEEFCKFEEGVRRTNPTWSDSLKALSDAAKKINILKEYKAESEVADGC